MGRLTIAENLALRSKHCGNAVELDTKYRLHPVGSDSVCPERVTALDFRTS